MSYSQTFQICDLMKAKTYIKLKLLFYQFFFLHYLFVIN